MQLQSCAKLTDSTDFDRFGPVRTNDHEGASWGCWCSLVRLVEGYLMHMK